ncbi:MAG: PilW family protein [Pseudomonadota bacterium]
MRRQSGLSLVELMISIALGLVLMTGVVQMFLSSRVVFSTQQGLSRIQETGRLAVDFISKDIRMAAHYGCYRPAAKSSIDNPKLKLKGATLAIGAGLHTDFDVGIMGYDSFGALPHGAANDLGAVTAIAGNILVVRSANNAGVGVVLNAANTAGALTAYTTETIVNNCVRGICVGGAAVATDCAGAYVFPVSALAKAGNVLTVSHVAAWSLTDPLQSFALGDELLPVNTTVYFLATGAGGGPSLWQRTNTDAALELVEGVENMRITYATSANTTYRLASALAATEWDFVQAVRVELLVRSLENNVLNERQPYTFGGVLTTPPVTDRRMRQVFTTTAAIRSRMVLN